MIESRHPTPIASRSQEVNGTSTSVDYTESATRALKGLLDARRMTYADLAQRLTEMGEAETETSVSQKVRRGSFQLAFFLLCMDALRVEEALVIAPSATLSFPVQLRT
jgi:hypothetical protein